MKELLQEELFIRDLVLILCHVVVQLNMERGLIFSFIGYDFYFSFAKNLWLLPEQLLTNICLSKGAFEGTFTLISFKLFNFKDIAQQFVGSFGGFASLFDFLLILVNKIFQVKFFSGIEEMCTRLVLLALNIGCWIR